MYKLNILEEDYISVRKVWIFYGNDPEKILSEAIAKMSHS